MTQQYWTRRQLLDGQIERASRAIEAAAQDTIFAAPAIAQWIASPADWSGKAPAATVMKTVLALQAARVVNASALKALDLTPSTVKRWRDAVASARRRDKALDAACGDAVEEIRITMHEAAMADAARAKQERLKRFPPKGRAA